MGDRIIVTEGETLGTRTMIEIGVGSYERQNRDRRDVRNISNIRLRSGSRATTIGIELDVSSAESMTIS